MPLKLNVGANFRPCPYCAALCWPLVTTLMRFEQVICLRDASATEIYSKTVNLIFTVRPTTPVGLERKASHVILQDLTLWSWQVVRDPNSRILRRILGMSRVRICRICYDLHGLTDHAAEALAVEPEE